MKGKVILITGATGGIGLETARALARMGSKIVIVGRSPEKTNQVVADLQQTTGSQHIDSFLADLSLMAETRKLAEAFKAKYERLDVLINNAGAMFTSRQTTAEGLELTFALNHISYFVLTNLLLDILKDTAPARIVNVASDAHKVGALDFNNLQSEQRFNPMLAYGRSKLMNIMFTYELARRMGDSGVTVNALHPGVVRSGFGHNNGRIISLIMHVMQRLGGISVEKGAQTSVYLASSSDVGNITGQYFDKNKPVLSSKESYDQDAWKRLWEVSEQITGIHILSAAH